MKNFICFPIITPYNGGVAIYNLPCSITNGKYLKNNPNNRHLICAPSGSASVAITTFSGLNLSGSNFFWYPL